MSVGKKVVAGVLVLVLALAALLLVGVVFVAPAVAKKLVEERLERVESKLGLEISTGSIETVGLGGVEITDLAVRDPQSSRTLVTVKRAGGKVSLPKLLIGKKVITAVWSEDVDVTITREKDGQFDLVNVVKRARGDKSEDEEESEKDMTADESGGLLRYFGGTLPAVDVSDVQVNFAIAPGATPFPVVGFAVPMLEIAHDDGIAVSMKVSVTSLEGSEWTLPSEVDVAALLSEELKPQTLNVKFDRAVEVSGLEPIPFLRAGFAGVELSPEGLVTITDAHVGFRSEEKAFARTKRVSLAVATWALNPKDIVFSNLTIDAPHMTLNYDAQGASELADLDHATRAPRARDVAASARRFARDVEERRRRAAAKEPASEEEEDAAAEAAEPEAPTSDKADGSKRLERLLTRIPQEIVIRDATIEATDDRELPVVRRARALRLEGGELIARHDIVAGTVHLEGGFRALADDKKRGSAKGLIDFGYRTKKVGADIEIDALDLSWIGQILGPAVANNVRGGTLRAKLDVKPGTGKAVTIDGSASVENLVYFWHLLAEEPVEEFTASYGFTATYDPDGKMPSNRLLKKGLYKESNTPAANDPIHQGSLVFTKGAAQMGEAKATVLPAIYGTGALPSRMPARIDLKVDLPKTPVQTLFNAVPVAIQGPLAGTELAGNFAWKLDVELPLYRAGDMEWVSTPLLEDFEIISIPTAVDPRNLMTGFRLTIQTVLQDDKGNDYEWSRTVRIPKAEPVSAKYLIENAGLDLADLDARRREREWPPVPDARKSWLPKTMIESPDYWLSSAAEAQTAKRPWKDDDVIERGVDGKQPYGPYVFVPLQYISKWVVRTVTTTEDGGFFRHPGFLFDSLKESVEDNIEANRFRRGGSTISMQLVKNAFLDQKKLLARKLREAFVVWLMESVVNVPKSRILEVYLNIIEFGPAIYGIHDASVHYFGKRPDQLEVAEVAWLFSILPAPKKYHFYWEKAGKISDKWFAKMTRYLDAMVRRKKLSAEEREAAVLAPPEFWKPNILNGDPVLRPTVDTGGFFGIPLLNDFDPSPSPSPAPGIDQIPPTSTPGQPTPKPLPVEPEKKKKKGWFWNR